MTGHQAAPDQGGSPDPGKTIGDPFDCARLPAPVGVLGRGVRVPGDLAGAGVLA